jgi:hypothetical protein
MLDAGAATLDCRRNVIFHSSPYLAGRRMAASPRSEHSLGQVPDATADGRPPDATPAADRWTAPDREALPRVLAGAEPIVSVGTGSAQEGLFGRETPVLLRRRDGSLAEGTVDLAFREATSDGAQWSVLDFKTDREFAPAAAHYVHQVRLYSEAISASTRLPCTGVLLVV